MVDIVTRLGKGSPLTNAEVDANFTNLAEVSGVTGEPMGHEDRTTSTISFNASTRTFTIAPTASSFTVWCKGKKVVVSSARTVTIPNTTGMYSIYFDSTGTLAAKSGYFTFAEEAPTAYIYWNATTGTAPYFGDERHGVVLDWQTHEYLHRTRGAALASGFSASGYVLGGSGSLNSHAQLTLEGGTFFDEDMKIIVTATNTPTAGTWEQDLTSPARIPVLYLSGTAWVIDSPTDYPLKQGTARPQYNAFSGGVWSTADVANNKYATSWILATNNLTYPVIAIIGQAESDLQSAAEAVDFTALQLPGFPSVEFRPLYKLIFQCADSCTNAVHASLVSITDIRSIAAAGTAASIVTDHGNLSGLSDDDHPQYIHVDTVRGSLTAAVKASFLPSQTSNAGKFLQTDGTATSWQALTSGNVTTALGFTPYNATNPSGFITGITSGNVTTALGFTPYNATNPSGYVTAAGARGSISVTGAGSYDSATGVINIVGGVTSFNTRTGAITLSSADVTTALGFTPYNNTNPSGYITGITSTMVTTALGYTPYNSSNPSGYITGITSGMVTTALGFTPYNNSNPSGYITSAALSPYLTTASAASTYLTLSGDATRSGTTTLSGVTIFNNYISLNGDFYHNGNQYILNPAQDGWINIVNRNGGSPFINNVTYNGSTILHAGNYSSYALPLTGGTLSGNLVVNSSVASQELLPLLGGSTYNWNGSSISYWWTRIANLSGVDGHASILITSKTDVNYVPYVAALLSIAKFNGTSLSVKLDTLTSNDMAVNVRIDNNNDVWLQTAAEWSSYKNWRVLNRFGTITIYTSGFTEQLTTPANSVLIECGQQVRATQGAVTSATVGTNSANIFGGVASRGAITQAGNQVLHAGNYNSYSPTLTGTGASGTWAINITGSAATATDSTKLPLAGGDMSGRIRMGTFAQSQNNTGEAWIGRAADRSTGTMTVQLGNSADRVFEIVDNPWSTVIFNAGMNSFNYKGSAILHAGNYNSYSPTLTGTGASGTWGISITGSAGSATSATTTSRVTGGNLSPAGTAFNNALISASGSNRVVTFDGNGGSPSVWWSNGATPIGAIDALGGGGLSFWSNNGSGWQQQVNMTYGTFNVLTTLQQGGNQVLHAGNVSSYALPIGGGTLTGNLNIVGGRVTASSGGTNTYGIFSGYDNNNHFIGLRCVVTGSTTSPTFTGNHQTTLVEYAEANDSTGWFFKSSQSGSYVEVARITRSQMNWNGNTVLHAGNVSSYAHTISSDPSTSGPGALAIGNNGSYSFVQSHAGQPLRLNPVGNPVQVGSNTVLHAGNYSSYALPIGGGTITGNRPIELDTNGGSILIKGDSGGWGMGLYFRGSDNVVKGSFGALGGGAGFSYLWAGLDYANPWMTFTSGQVNSTVALTQGNNQVLHAGNYTGFSSIFRALGAPSSSNDWNGLGNTYANSVIQVDPSNFSSTSNGPTAASYTYGTLLNFTTNSNSQSQIFISHAGNDLIFRGGWGGASWQTWNKVLTNQNYNSYSPTLTGGNASGTWGISITGSAASLDGVAASNYFRSDGTYPNTDLNTPVEGYWHVSSSATGLPEGYYGHRWDYDHLNNSQWVAQMYSPTSGDAGLWFRQRRNFDWQTWRKFLDSSNYGSYALPLSGGTISGNLTMNGPGSSTSIIFGDSSKRINVEGYWMMFKGHENEGFRWQTAGQDGVTFTTRMQLTSSALTTTGSFTASGNVTAYSDERLKKDWAALPADFIARLATVKSGTYTRIDSGERQAGSSAQDWQALLPEVVSASNDEAQTLALAYGNAALVSAVELAKDNVELRARIERLESLINKLIGD